MHLHESTKEISRQIIKSSSIRPLSNRKQKTTYTGHIETLKNIIRNTNSKGSCSHLLPYTQIIILLRSS
ncbi:hypothetical protein, partial [uncultured Parabacteroides sp.]|uniref:hypothetical protein n=1 Tax=uncultured Parabacteroides sp. TaxID=512312 RepID=UPI0028044704